jgi:SAM-dependent methyltransferase
MLNQGHNAQANDCRVCVSGFATPVFMSVRGMVYRCSACGVLFLGSKGFASDSRETGFHSMIDEKKYRAYFEPFRKAQYRSVLSSLGLKPGSSHLDVGASYGWMVEVGLELKLDSYGVEPGSVQYDPVVRERIFTGSLQRYAEEAARRFDVVTLWHVLEHLQEPHEAINQLYRLIRDDGYLVIAVPTTDGRLFRLGLFMQRRLGRPELLNKLFLVHNPAMHLFYYNQTSLGELLKHVALKVISAQTLESFDWTAMHRRADSFFLRTILKAIGPIIAQSGFTRLENLIVVARRSCPQT